MNLIKSPDLINLNDTDTDAEIQYKVTMSVII